MDSKRANLTQKRLREILNYCPETGDFYNLENRGRYPSGAISGHIRRDGYLTITIDQLAYLGHRLAWLYMMGAWTEEIDHIDGNPSNNRWNNLRAATRSQNKANVRRQSNNTSGYKGVSFDKRKKLFRVDVKHQRKQYFGGYFRSAKEAHKARTNLAIKLHGEFARSE